MTDQDEEIRALRDAARQAGEASTRWGEFAATLKAMAEGLEVGLEPEEAGELLMRALHQRQAILAAVGQLKTAPLRRRN